MGEDIKVWHVVCAVVCVLLAGVLVYMIHEDKREQGEKARAIEAVKAEAKTYEEECQNLKDELALLKNNIYYSSDSAEIMVGFVVSAVSDTAYIEAKAEEYNFEPVFVIDCAKNTDDIEEIIDAVGDKGEIMLYASYFSENVNENVLSVLSYLESVNLEQTGVFFLRSGDLTDSNMQLLIDEGFTGFTVYNESPKAGQSEDGTVYFDYSYLTSAGRTVVSRIAALYQNKASIILAFDMESINSGVIPEAYVNDLFDGILTYTDNEDCSFSTAADVIEELSQINKTEKDRQQEYEQRSAEIRERIEELEKTIHDIYKKAE